MASKKEKTNCLKDLYKKLQNDDIDIDELTESDLNEPFIGNSYELDILVDL